MWNKSLVFLALGFVFGIVFVWALLSMSFHYDFLSCSDLTTTVCDYQALIAGAFALLAGCVTAFYIRCQIRADVKNHNRQLSIQNLQFEHDLHHKVFGLSSALAGEIESLIKGVDADGYERHFQIQWMVASADPNHKVSAFAVHSNYFQVFEGNSSEIGILQHPFPRDICYWYTSAMGFVDTVKSVNEGYYRNDNQLRVAEMLQTELADLKVSGRKLYLSLFWHSKLNKRLALGYRQRINKLLESD